MISRFLVKTNYLNHYSLRLLMGNFLLVVPTLCVALCFLIGGNVNFLWGLPLCGIMGWVLVLPSTYTLSRSSKERVAVDSLVGGFMAMLFLCSLMIPLKKTSSEKPTDHQIQKLPRTIKEQLDPRDRNSKEQHLEHVG